MDARSAHRRGRDPPHLFGALRARQPRFERTSKGLDLLVCQRRLHLGTIPSFLLSHDRKSWPIRYALATRNMGLRPLGRAMERWDRPARYEKKPSIWCEGRFRSMPNRWRKIAQLTTLM